VIGGKVHDVRFHRYDGPRSGRAAALWSMTRWSALRALGARRGWKAKVIPIALTLIAFFPALIVLGLRALFASSIDTNLATVLPYSDYANITGLVILVFAVVITPELLCPDRRDGTLSLYFATAVGRGDYVLGKVLAAILPLLLVTVLPPTILYAGNVLFATHPLGYVQEHTHDIPRILASGTAVSLYFAFVGLAISSLTGRRAFAVGGYLAFLIVPTIIAGILADNLDNADNLRLFAFAAVPIHTARNLYPDSPTIGDPTDTAWALTWLLLIVLSALVLVWRFRGDEG
jgi:ABC-2 type transport system permease protein